MLMATFWSHVPVAQRHACKDSIVLVPGKLEAAECDPDQALSYMRDFTGERYVLCRCNPNIIPDNTPEIPLLPKELLSPDDQGSAPPREEHPMQQRLRSSDPNTYSL